MGIKIFSYDGARGALSIQKNEKNHKNSTYYKIKFYIISINIYFFYDG